MAPEAVLNTVQRSACFPLLWGLLMAIRLLIVDDHAIVRDGLRSLFAGEPDMEVVGEAENGQLAVQRCRELSPDVAILDVSMPVMNGIEASRAITSLNGTRTIMLTVHSEPEVVTSALESGAKGFLLKQGGFAELAAAVRAVYGGKCYLSPSVADYLVSSLIQKNLGTAPPAEAAFHELSSRERQVLQLLAEGNSSKEIAGRLDLSIKTIEAHRHQIMKRLRIHSIAGLTKYAVRHRLTEL